MKRTILLGLLTVALVTPSQASAHSKCVGDPEVFDAFPCSHSFVARKRPQTWTFNHGASVDSYASRWVTADGRKFLAGDRRDCTMFGRYGALRVREVFCEGQGPLRVVVRSVDGPTPVRFSFAILEAG